MDTIAPSRFEVLGRSLAVVIGWNGLLLGAAVLWWLGLSDVQPGADCQGDGLGLECAGSPRDNARLGVMFVGGPMFVGALLLGFTLTVVLAGARVRSGVLAGTVAAVIGWVAVLAVAVSL